jgi:transposase
VKASRYAVWNFLRREAISFKKSLHAAEQDRPDAARRRARWRRHQAKLDPRRLVFIDETWAKTNMTRTHGRCARGRRLRALAPHGHWKTMTFIAALRCDAITAPVVFDQPINGEWFKAYVEQVLVPTLSPGDVVVMDNLGSRRGKAIRRAIRQVGAKLLFLPKYSPDLNPIEQVFSKLKHLLRKAQARSCDAVLSAINRTLRTYAPDECQNYFQNSGYGVV